ncbi:VPS10 domain-containing protein [Robertkochia aurantiaca]|uniref:VPS10 domain-containing protein n=1 Tax=Robertkochia aurantiaca TaxID=2873700 RepID=UPI001CC90FC7|nr:glycosyl hydrolase [Robertkochia sp. 3YJGBD-33]
MKTSFYVFLTLLFFATGTNELRSQQDPESLPEFKQLKWRNIGPFRGGRSVACTGVPSDPLTYYMGTTGGGVWKTTDAGITWKNISDGFFKTGTVGALAVAPSDPNVIYVGMGEHAARGVMTSTGDGVYRSTDAGKTWTHIGIDNSRHISDVIIHPENPDIVYVAVQGAQYGPSEERGVYRSRDGGKNWEKLLYTHDRTGASSLEMDPANPRILYASLWEHRRYPWVMESGGEHSGLYKSTDGGDSWEPMTEGLPETMGKSAITVSGADSERLWAVIEAEGKKGGVYRSDNAGKSWQQVNNDRINIARSWYYMEIFADPADLNTVYVLNAPMLKSIDGGRSFTPVSTPHGDNHDLWINPLDTKYMINANDGGANVSLNGGRSWSTQENQPTAQFYRVSADNQVPYMVYGGQQDNSAIAIMSRTNDNGIDWKDWFSVAGCESAYLAFDPNDPEVVYGGCYQGIIDAWNRISKESKQIKAYPELSLGNEPGEMKFRFNWNAPIIFSQHQPNTVYHAGNVILKTTDGGISWEAISGDLTKNEADKQGPGGRPFTNEAAGGENYNTIMYLAESPQQAGVLWAGTDDGLLHRTDDEGKNWTDVTPGDVKDGIINSIEISPHNPETVYITVMRYKQNDLKPYIYKTTNNGKSWKLITEGIEGMHTFVRVVREDPVSEGLLYAGTETGMYVSVNGGKTWKPFQLNLPVVPINDLTIRQNDLIAATAGRSFWILDDLSPLQQSMLEKPEQLTIYSPKETYLFVGGRQNDLSNNVGQNPESGVTFDYFIPETKDSIELKLEVINDQGNIIRTIGSKAPEAFASWPGGPSKPAVLPAEPGFNRFTWDFRKSTLPAVEKVFVYGDYRGNYVIPGTYELRLITESDTVSTPVTIRPNPNIKASMEDYREQERFTDEIDSLITEIHETVNGMRTTREQLENYSKLMQDKDGWEDLRKQADTLISAIDAWERELIQPEQKTFQDVINFNNQLNAELMYLKNYTGSADPKLTQGARLRLDDLLLNWKEQQQRYDEIVNKGFETFNRMYREKGVPAIIMSEKP